MSSKNQQNKTFNKDTYKTVEAIVPKKYVKKVKRADEQLTDAGQVNYYEEKQTKQSAKASTSIKKKAKSKDSKNALTDSNNKTTFRSVNKQLPSNKNESSFKKSTKAASECGKKESTTNKNQSKAKLLVKKVKDLQKKISGTKLFETDKKKMKAYSKAKQEVIAQSDKLNSLNEKLEGKNHIDETKPLIVSRTLDCRPVIVEGMQPLPPEQVASIKRRLYASIERATRIALRKESLARNSGIPSAPALIRNTRASKAKNQAIAIKYNLKKKKQVRFHEPLVLPTNSHITVVSKKKHVRFFEKVIRLPKTCTSDVARINESNSERKTTDNSSDSSKTRNKQININDKNENVKKVQFASSKIIKNLDQPQIIEPSTSGLNQPKKGIIREGMKYKKYVRYPNPMTYHTNITVRNTFLRNGLHPSDSRTLYPHLLWKNRVAAVQGPKYLNKDTPPDEDPIINLQPPSKCSTNIEKTDDSSDEEPHEHEIVQFKNCRLRPPTPGPPPLAALDDTDSDSVETTSSKPTSRSPCSSRSFPHSRSVSTHSSDSSLAYYRKKFRRGWSYDREGLTSSKQPAITLQKVDSLGNKIASKRRSLAMDTNKVDIGSKSRPKDVTRHKTNKPSLDINKKETKGRKENIVRKSGKTSPTKTGNVDISDSPTTPMTPLKPSNYSQKVSKLHLTAVPSTYLDNQFACRQPIFSNETLLPSPVKFTQGLGNTEKIAKPTRLSMKSQIPFKGKKDLANRRNLGVAAFGKDLDLQMKFYEDQVLNSIGGSVIRSVTNSIKKNYLNKGKKKTVVRKDKPVQFSEHEVDILEKKGYILGDRIAKNRNTAVHLAIFTDPTTNFKVKLACKVVDKSNYKSDLIKKFLPRELEIVKSLKHPNLISAHSILDCGIKSFIFVSYAERGNLLEYIRNHGSLAELHAKIWFKQIVSGANYLHNHQIVHRDLKCENILITNNYSLQISDFRLARSYTANQGLSQTYCGSASYCAPEVISCQPYDPKIADVWSLGVILYIMLNGSMPFSDSSLLSLLRNQFNRNWAFRPGLTRILSRPPILIIERCLEPDVSLRYSMSQLATSEFLSLDLEFKRIGSKGFVDLYLRQLPKFFSDPIRKVKEITSTTEEKYKDVIKNFIGQPVKNKKVKTKLKQKKFAKLLIKTKHTSQNQSTKQEKHAGQNEKHKLKSSAPNRTITKTSVYHKTCLNPSRNNNYNAKPVATFKKNVLKIRDDTSAPLLPYTNKKKKIPNAKKHNKGEQTN